MEEVIASVLWSAALVWPVSCFVYSSFRPSSWFCIHCCSLSGLSAVLCTLRLDHLHGFVFTVVHCLACQLFCVLLCLDCLHGFVFTVVHCLACSHGKLLRGACIQMKGEKTEAKRERVTMPCDEGGKMHQWQVVQPDACLKGCDHIL